MYSYITIAKARGFILIFAKIKLKKDFAMKYIKLLSMMLVILAINGCVQTVKEPTKETRPIYTPSVVHREPVTPIIIDNTPPPVIIDTIPVEEILPPQEIFSTNSIGSRYLQGAYANNYKLKQFINTMVNKHHFTRSYLNAVFSSVSRDTEALKKIGAFGTTAKPNVSKRTTTGTWDKYRSNFLTSSRIGKGVKFWKENKYYLEKASRMYGVAPEYIIGIIGVETNFGGFTGKHKLLDALTSISLEFPKRTKFFTSELENYLLMTREQRMDPRRIEGSYAGAFGLSQFMPSSFRSFAVDLDGNGQINLFTKADAIGSVANYFKERGKWNPRIPVAVLTTYNKPRFYGIATGFKTSYSQSHLYSLGMRPVNNFYGYRGSVSLIKLNRYHKDEMWWGTPNFYSIARYNPKDHYAMAVHQLAQAVKINYYRR